MSSRRLAANCAQRLASRREKTRRRERPGPVRALLLLLSRRACARVVGACLQSAFEHCMPFLPLQSRKKSSSSSAPARLTSLLSCVLCPVSCRLSTRTCSVEHCSSASSASAYPLPASRPARLYRRPLPACLLPPAAGSLILLQSTSTCVVVGIRDRVPARACVRCSCVCSFCAVGQPPGRRDFSAASSCIRCTASV
jgi:hypothetical protein